MRSLLYIKNMPKRDPKKQGLWRSSIRKNTARSQDTALAGYEVS